MPALYSPSQHQALEAVARHLLLTERLFASLDDLFVVCQPRRVMDVHHIVAVENTGVEPRRSRAARD